MLSSFVNKEQQVASPQEADKPIDPLQELAKSYFDQARDDFGELGEAIVQTEGLNNFRHSAVREFDEERAAMTLEELRENFGEVLCTNYEEMIHMLDPVKQDIEDVLAERSLIITSNHPTLATPIYHSLAMSEMFGPDIRNRMYVVIGPYPVTFRVEMEGMPVIDPLDVLNSAAGILMTSPVSPGAEKIKGARETQKAMQKRFKDSYDEIAGEPGNVIILCSGGSRDLEMEGGFRYIKRDRSNNGHRLVSRSDAATLPVGVHDHVFGKENAANGYSSRIDIVPGSISRVGIMRGMIQVAGHQARAIQEDTVRLANKAAHRARDAAKTPEEMHLANYLYELDDQLERQY